MNTTRKWLSPLRWLQNAWLQFRIGIARRRNARLAIDKLETQTQLLHSPLQKYNVNQLKKLAIRHKRDGRPQVAEGCKAEIQRRIYVGQHRDEIFITPKIAKAVAVIAMLFFAVSAHAEEKQSAVIPNVLWSTTGFVVLGLIGILVIGYYVLGCISSAKDLFGKKPPMHEELTGIHKKIYAVKRDLEEADEADRKMVDERFRELAIDRQRTLEGLNEKIGDVASDVAFIRGKLSKEEK